MQSALTYYCTLPHRTCGVVRRRVCWPTCAKNCGGPAARRWCCWGPPASTRPRPRGSPTPSYCWAATRSGQVDRSLRKHSSRPIRCDELSLLGQVRSLNRTGTGQVVLTLTWVSHVPTGGLIAFFDQPTISYCSSGLELLASEPTNTNDNNKN